MQASNIDTVGLITLLIVFVVSLVFYSQPLPHLLQTQTALIRFALCVVDKNLGTYLYKLFASLTPSSDFSAILSLNLI